MRLLVVSTMYPPHHYGGYELQCRDIVERWRANGNDVHVLVTTLRLPGVPDAPAESARVRRELEFYWRDHNVLDPPLARVLLTELHNRRVVSRALDEVQPDVVSVWHMAAMSFGILSTITERQIPTVFVTCDDWFVYGPQLDPWIRAFADRPRLARTVTRVTGLPTSLPVLGPNAAACFVSDWVRRRAEELGPLRPPITGVVYSGIEPRDFFPKDVDRAWTWKLLYVGRLDEHKGVHYAIEALSRLPGAATLEVVGRGDERYEARLREEATKLGVSARVTFAGHHPRDQLRHRYTAADVLLFPGVWHEPFGLVPLESMACGTPVVATGTGGSAEYLVDGRNCLLVPPYDAAAIAAAVDRLASDPVLRGSLRVEGLRTASAMTVDHLARDLERWHAAAAAGFVDGRPEDSAPPLDRVGRR